MKAKINNVHLLKKLHCIQIWLHFIIIQDLLNPLQSNLCSFHSPEIVLAASKILPRPINPTSYFFILNLIHLLFFYNFWLLTTHSPEIFSSIDFPNTALAWFPHLASLTFPFPATLISILKCSVHQSSFLRIF